MGLSSQEAPKTAGWQDLLKYAARLEFTITQLTFQLFRLVTLQTCILDTEGSLSSVVQEIDKILEEDVISTLVSFYFLPFFPAFLAPFPPFVFVSIRLIGI